jgi:sec-independent protein translocase protein TatA
MVTLAFYNNPTALIIVALVVVLLFGSQKIPELMRSIGQGTKEFKKGLNGEEDDELRREKEREAEVRRRVEEEMRREETLHSK